ncbi:unnamed protein product, partial [marine sediment metagenome]
MKYKIGVFGSAGMLSQKIRQKAHDTGKELAKRQCIVITGATTGISDEAVISAFKYGGKTWGFSPAINAASQQKFIPAVNIKNYSKIFFIPPNFPYKDNHLVCKIFRNITSTATCEAGIIISGRWGTLNEFTNLYDMGKVIGVVTETGGIADELSNLCD